MAQKRFKNNKTKHRTKEIAKILYLLRLNQLTQVSVAKELGISTQVVNNVIHGRYKSSRVETWLKENLGV